jgi:hypothetical protein
MAVLDGAWNALLERLLACSYVPDLCVCLQQRALFYKSKIGV